MFGKGAYNNFRSQFFKKSSQPGKHLYLAFINI